MVIFLCWILGAVLVGKHASNKGLSGISFFAISLFASPLVGLLLALVSSPDPEKTARRAAMKKCPECAEAVNQEARVCRFCGHSFADESSGILFEE
jgi:RNA polymerase subunit RPABC4/transcription elongation factor Spt4